MGKSITQSKSSIKDYPSKTVSMRSMNVGRPSSQSPGESRSYTPIWRKSSVVLSLRKNSSICVQMHSCLEKKMNQYTPSPYLTFSIHLDGLEEEHDKAVDQKGVFKRAVKAIETAVKKGFRVTVNCTLFNNAQPEHVEEFFDHVSTLGIEGITVSPGYAYERAPLQDHFLSRKQTKNLFRDVFRRGKKARKKWKFNQSSLYLDFLAGNQKYHCTPWGNPTRNIFGWQKPCYLLAEGHVKTYDALIKKTNWGNYGTGKYEKCANCMVHCGYEATAVSDTVAKPWKAFIVWLKGVNTEKKMVGDIPLENQRPAHYVFDQQVSQFLKQEKTQKSPSCGGQQIKTQKQNENHSSAA